MQTHTNTRFTASLVPRVALVTGAATRLGRDIALALAGSGWSVAIHYRNSAEQAQQTLADCMALGAQAHPHARFHSFQADLSDATQCADLAKQVSTHFGSWGALVNSASVFEHDSASSASTDSAALHWHTNTMAPVLLTQALYAHAQQHKACAVAVNMLDQKLWNMNPDFFSYTLSKAALETATTMLAQALAPTMRVVGVAPGLTLTSHMLTDAQFQALHKLSPLGQSSTPQDVAATVLFALSNASITGTTLLVDGGQHLQKFDRDFSLMAST
ncbi:MAG: SDR family oxidoreductase [Burkholderiaceae bacterium]|nr:SDR family oxidoreductase [Burkholderiaceae bacterium]